ncbi:dihydroorotase family protein [Lutibacter sp.]|uniref:dihydroorotase n=1 Tax=Lutibacter sp. TaxID=1925666 RepID=UPI001A29A770|nr:dihydroorotase [Lutibacter sp.]MBI9041212.1 dihydroorotase [Lutibacter sp.]
MNILIKSAIIFDSSSPFHQQKNDILIEKGTITKIAKSINNPNNYQEIKLDNLHVSQGWFDSSVCFGEPGLEERETIANGLFTAAKSGFTAVAVNPNTNPVADNKSTIEFIKHKASGFASKLFPIGNFTKGAQSADLAELYDMQNSGAIAFGDYNKSICNANLLKIGLQYAQNFDGLILSFPQDNSIATEGLVNEEVNSTKLGLKGIPGLAEELQIARDLFILEYTGGKLHIPTISTEKAVKLIKDAKKKGLNVTCSVAVHHLVLTDDELKSFNSNTKVLPPLRTPKDTKALIKALKEGVIDMVTSDHNPIDIEHKKVEYYNAKFGTIGLESLFGALNSVLDLDTLINSLTTKSKTIFKIETTTIAEGQKADLTLFNPAFEYEFKESDILSTSKNSLFIDKKMNGKVYGIIANNNVVL